MKTVIIIIVVLFVVKTSLGQNQGNIWFFGNGVGMDFNNGVPVPIFEGNIYPFPQSQVEATIAEGSASICDSNGDLLFYSNGESIWNRNHELMPNGDSLMGMYSSTQSALIIPQPLSDSVFYVFTTDGLERNLEDGLRYSLVDMCLDNGLGDVIEEKKNVLLLDTVSEKLAGIIHENGKDIWLISHKYNSDAFYAYLLSENGISEPVVTRIGSVHSGNGASAAIGQMKASSDGRMIGLVFSNISPSVAEVFSFDKATGILSSHRSLSTDGGEYGIEFSPDNSKLYMTNFQGLQQFDLYAGDGSQNAINATKTNISSMLCSPSGLQLGPDGKIYVRRCATHVACINKPNFLGDLCDYVDNQVDFDTVKVGSSFPSFVQGFDYHNETYTCNPVANSDLVNDERFELYPNPSIGSVTLEFNQQKDVNYFLTIYDFKGQSVRKKNRIDNRKETIDVEHLNSGLYFFQLSTEQYILFNKKVLVL